jgi:orotate phosphoribosyltransferase
MQAYKRRFVEFMVEAQVLTFGDFVTKSGRKSPYFVNTGRYRTGSQLARLAEFYVDAIEAEGLDFDFLFGPAYKGIPLVVACSMEFHRRGRELPFCFNRKESKQHGEGGELVGHSPRAGERVLIVEDVTTAGTSIRETAPLLYSVAPVKFAGLVVSVDRSERAGFGPEPEQSALQALAAEYDLCPVAIVTVREIMEVLRGRPVNGDVLLTETLHERMLEYLQEYGAS